MTRRFLFIVHYPVFGGPHNQALRLDQPLLEAGWKTSVLLPDDPGTAQDFLESAGVDVVRIRLGRLRAATALGENIALARGFRTDVAAIRHVIRRREVDLVVVAGLVNPHAAVAARLEGVPVVWQLLDTLPPVWLRRILMPLVTQLADVVMTTGMSVARAHPGATRMGERLVPFFPVDVDTFKPDAAARSRARAELGLGAHDIVVGNVSNLSPMKDHRTFLRAAAKIRTEFPEARFVVLGAAYDHRAQYTDSLLQEAESLGLALDSSLTLRDPGRRVAELAPAFDVFWLTSLPRSEGVPTVIGEAMALALPVVATDVGSVREAVVDGVTGTVVPPLDPDAVARATIPYLRDDALRRRAGNAGRERAESHFAVDACAATHVRAFELATARGRVRRAATFEGPGSRAPHEYLYRVLVCPICRGGLDWEADSVVCADCGRRYERKGGIPLLVATAADDLHKRQQASYFDHAEGEWEIARPHEAAALYRWLMADKLARSVASLVSMLPGATALTVCGGSGMDAEFLARAGARVIASDISLESARRAAERARRHGLAIAPLVADVEALPFRDRSIDLVYVHDGLHHLESPIAGLREMMRVSGGAVSVNEPARAQATMLAARLRLAGHHEEAGNFIARVDPATVVDQLRANGYAIVRNERYGMVYRHVPGAVSRLLSRTPLLQLTVTGMRGFNAVAGSIGNKLTVQAVRTES